jgi:type II secretory pathway pseudopilin PulG
MRDLLDRQSGITILEVLIAIVIATILMVVALPRLQRAQMVSNEASAIGSMRSIHSAQHAYFTACGNGFYSPGLANLGVGLGGQGAGFINPDLSGDDWVVKRGYRFHIAPGPTEPTAPASCNGLGPGMAVWSWSATGHPTEVHETGDRYFVSNQNGTLWEADFAVAPFFSGDPPPGARPIDK